MIYFENNRVKISSPKIHTFSSRFSFSILISRWIDCEDNFAKKIDTLEEEEARQQFFVESIEAEEKRRTISLAANSYSSLNRSAGVVVTRRSHSSLGRVFKRKKRATCCYEEPIQRFEKSSNYPRPIDPFSPCVRNPSKRKRHRVLERTRRTLVVAPGRVMDARPFKKKKKMGGTRNTIRGTRFQRGRV